MTREEEIVLASKQHKNSLFSNYGDAFIAGAKWADEHPINVWHDASKEPLKDRVFLVELGAGKYGFQTFILVENNIEFNWSEWVKEVCLLRWAYISDLLPKE